MGKGTHIYHKPQNAHGNSRQHWGDSATRIVDSSNTVYNLKEQIAAEHNIEDADSLAILADGLELDNYAIFGELGFTELHVEGEVLGEGKGGKRKKKVYKTPKRIPHKKKPVKMMALRYFKIEGSGEVTLTRKICNRCGHLMANHYDRYACGFCGNTLFKLTPSGERITVRGPQVKKVEKVVEEAVDDKKGKGKKGKK